MRNISEKKNCRENQNTHFMFSTFFFLSFFNSAVYEIMWKNIVEPGRPQVTIQRMCITCWIPKATNTHSEYVFLIDFARQHCLHERASMLRCAYIACLVTL